MNEILRTPQERFANLPGFLWSPHSRDDLGGFAGLAMSYLDEGPATAPATSAAVRNRSNSLMPDISCRSGAK
jgi:hypothetical protein